MPEPRDDREFERLHGEHHRMVFQIAYSVLGNAADAEEVAQDAFVRAHREWTELREGGNFRAWVGTIAWRAAINHRRSWLRRLRRDGVWFGTRPVDRNAETDAQTRDFSRRVRAEIERLPEKLRQVLLLSAIDGLDSATIGAMLEIPEGTVRSRLHLARKQLLQAVTK